MAPRKSGRGTLLKAPKSLDFLSPRLGHSSPHHCPPQCPHASGVDPLGTPLSIREVAELLGCSPWTIRQKYLPSGLPYFRLGPTGKLIFYRNQIIRWMLAHQKKGGYS
jgi:hypothetical protein